MATAEDAPMEAEPAELLRYGLPFGVGAFAVGTLVTYVIANADATIDFGFTDAAVFYGIFHGIVRLTAGGESAGMLINESGGAALLAAAVPALPLLVLGYLAVRQFEQRESAEASGAKIGAALAGGYLLAMLVVALAFELEVGSFLLGSGPIGASLDPITAAIAGVLFGGVVGGAGGALADVSRGKYVVIALAAVLAILNLLLYAGASS